MYSTAASCSAPLLLASSTYIGATCASYCGHSSRVHLSTCCKGGNLSHFSAEKSCSYSTSSNIAESSYRGGQLIMTHCCNMVHQLRARVTALQLHALHIGIGYTSFTHVHQPPQVLPRATRSLTYCTDRCNICAITGTTCGMQRGICHACT